MTKAKQQQPGQPQQPESYDQPEQFEQSQQSQQPQSHATVEELTSDLQRMRADFENYRKRVDSEKTTAREIGVSSTVIKLLPVIDNIERAIAYLPDDLKDNQWAQGIAGLAKSLNKSLESMDIKRIEASPGTVFNPELHEAVMFDDSATGDSEVISEELQAGYLLGDRVVRHAMVKVTRS